MSDKVYKKVRLVGCATEGIEAAITLALDKAAKSVHGISWFEVVEVRGAVRDGKVLEYQVTLDAAFKVD